MRIAHLTSVHPARDARIFHKECRALMAANHQVTLVVPHDRQELDEGIVIHGIPKGQSRFTRMTTTTWRVFRAALKQDADVFHFHDAELIPMAVLLKVLGHRVVYDVHEDMPIAVMNRDYLPEFVRPLIAKMAGLVEALGSRIFDGIIAATPTIAQRFPRNKTVLVQNFSICEEMAHAPAIPYRERPPSAAYVGLISLGRGVREMIQAVRFLPDRMRCTLELAGNFSPGSLLRGLTKEPGWDRVRWLGWLNRYQVAQFLGRSRVGLVTLQPLKNYVDSQPTKMFEYMAAGIPVIASNFPLWRRILEPARCAILVDPQSPREIAAAIRWILEHPDEAEIMGKRGQEWARRNYDWATEAVKLTKFYTTFQRAQHKGMAQASRQP